MNLSLLKTMKAEHLKLRRSPVWLAFFILPVISAFFGTANYKMNQGILTSEWYSLWSQHSLFLCYIFMPALIGTYCSYLWRLEHLHNNWNSFLTAPVSRFSLYFGKLFQAVVMIFAGNVWIFLLYCLCGKICRLPALPPVEAIGWFLGGILGGIVVCCIQLTVSMMIRSFALPIGIGLAGGIGGLAMTSIGAGLYYPYSLYSLGMCANNPRLHLDVHVFIPSCILYIVLFSIVSVIGICRHE
ncbi:MAG: ABC transporter permease [Eubacterium sp.]|nr:ABC transporter permease [Eubacterium sp.]